MLRKLLGRRAAKPQAKPRHPKTASEPSARRQQRTRPAGRSELTLSERLQLQSERGDATSWPAGEANSFAQPSDEYLPPEEVSLQPSTSGTTSGTTSGATPRTTPRTSPSPGDPTRHSLVGPSMVIQGELHAAEDLTISGRLEGALTHTAKRVMVAETGVVTANIRARNLIVEGRVDGDIECRNSVILKDTAQVTGNIQAVRISIADGARFSGKVVMVEAKSD